MPNQQTLFDFANRAHLAEIRAILEKDKKCYQSRLAGSTNNCIAAGETVTHSNHVGDMSQMVYEQVEAQSIRDETAIKLRDTEQALLRIEAGTYGMCDQCCTPIELARLRLIPTATLCANCANQRSSSKKK